MSKTEIGDFIDTKAIFISRLVKSEWMSMNFRVFWTLHLLVDFPALSTWTWMRSQWTLCLSRECTIWLPVCRRFSFPKIWIFRFAGWTRCSPAPFRSGSTIKKIWSIMWSEIGEAQVSWGLLILPIQYLLLCGPRIFGHARARGRRSETICTCGLSLDRKRQNWIIGHATKHLPSC